MQLNSWGVKNWDIAHYEHDARIHDATSDVKYLLHV